MSGLMIAGLVVGFVWVAFSTWIAGWIVVGELKSWWAGRKWKKLKQGRRL